MSTYRSTREHSEQRERDWFAPLACLSAGHDDRPVAEGPDPYRTCFVRDRDRVLHCGAFRRLKAKTQVFVIDEGDFYRTRLTHTLEVMQMARFVAQALRLNDTLAEVLALVHDIGHPPFGHEGERVLDLHSDVAFDHNRQALRIVDVLETPYHDRPGLNLTHVVRRSILKHGGEAGRGAPTWPGAMLEAQIADLADSTAYQHHDLEDGLRSGILSEEMLVDELAIWRDAAEQVDDDGLSRRKRIKATLNAMLKASLHDLVDTSRAALGATDARTAEDVAADNLRPIAMSPARAGMHRELGRFLMERYYRHERVTRSRAIADDAIGVIVEHYRDASDELPDEYRRRLDDEGVERTVCDYVAGMTDRFATNEWRRLTASRVVQPPLDWSPVDLDDEESGDTTSALERRLGHRFRSRDLLTTALTHSSARTTTQEPNQRLEFLGDAVLGLVVARMLYARFPDDEEGELSRIKSSVVSRHALRRVATGWNLVEHLVVGPGLRASGKVPPSVIADAVEAMLGAIHLDAGLDVVTGIIERDFGPLIDASARASRASNDKSELQHWTQGRFGFTPNYRVLEELGPDHEKTFTVAAVVNGITLAESSGRNKRQAEQRAAREALRVLKDAADGKRDYPEGLERA